MSEKSLQLVPPSEKQALIQADKPAQSIAGMLQAVIDRGVTQENVAALKELTVLYKDMQALEAKREFVSSLKEFQAEAKQIQAMKDVPNNDGTVRYKFAPFEEIMASVQPMADRHGFVITFGEGAAEAGKITKTCELMHISGHSKTNAYSVHIGQGPPKASQTQADGAAHTYAKRGALCDALNIVISKDDDARALGAKITKEQAASLRERVHSTGSDEGRFLKFAKASTFEDIDESMFAALDDNLRKKEKTA